MTPDLRDGSRHLPTAVGAALFVAMALALGQVLGMGLGPHGAEPTADRSLPVEGAAYQARFHGAGFTVDTGGGAIDWSLAGVETGPASSTAA